LIRCWLVLGHHDPRTAQHALEWTQARVVEILEGDIKKAREKEEKKKRKRREKETVHCWVMESDVKIHLHGRSYSNTRHVKVQVAVVAGGRPQPSCYVQVEEILVVPNRLSTLRRTHRPITQARL
jgi:hypothetical protein